MFLCLGRKASESKSFAAYFLIPALNISTSQSESDLFNLSGRLGMQTQLHFVSIGSCAVTIMDDDNKTVYVGFE